MGAFCQGVCEARALPSPCRETLSLWNGRKTNLPRARLAAVAPDITTVVAKACAATFLCLTAVFAGRERTDAGLEVEVNGDCILIAEFIFSI